MRCYNVSEFQRWVGYFNANFERDGATNAAESADRAILMQRDRYPSSQQSGLNLANVERDFSTEGPLA
jgi:hypothetical protein